MTNAEAAEAIRTHHAAMAAELRNRVDTLTVARRRGDAEAARQSVLTYLQSEVMPHALAEERALYPAGEAGAGSLLVRAMRDEHVDLMARIETMAATSEIEEVVVQASAILALFESHLHKENNLLIPLLLTDEDVSLPALLAGMHELLGEAAA